MMHLTPNATDKGLAFISNPHPIRVKGDFQRPLYYTGLTEIATIRRREGVAKQCKLDRKYIVHVPLNIRGGGYNWLVNP